jgi:hypothetical protein
VTKSKLSLQLQRDCSGPKAIEYCLYADSKNWWQMVTIFRYTIFGEGEEREKLAYMVTMLWD